ncbi:hypothetical protein JD844_027437, partial [Phrynosoma platyrhinos]
FKSWRGQQCIGPFKKFTCVIGPNGSGKSNVMDALSFVMGEKTSNLRVKHIQELIHGAHVGKPVSSTGSVKMVYSEKNGEEKTFSRIIRGNGSEFRINDSVVSRSVYTKELGEIGIITRARNCLVFQGEVETIAMKKPKERTQLFEQISNSGELVAEYVEKKKNMQQAEEDAQFSYNKKKNVAAERKRAKLEKEEMLFEELKERKAQLQLFQLYHNERKIDLLNDKFSAKNTNIDAKKSAVCHAEDTVKAKKKVLGMLNRNHQYIEKEIKSLEVMLNQKRPQYIKAKERTTHQIKKVDMAKKVLRDHMKEQAKREENKNELQAELNDIDKARRMFEQKVAEEGLRGVRDVLLEENQLRDRRLRYRGHLQPEPCQSRDLCLLFKAHILSLTLESEGEIREDIPVLVPQESATHRDRAVLGTEADDSEQEAEADRVLRAHPDLVYDTVSRQYLMPVDPETLPPYEGSPRQVQAQTHRAIDKYKELKELVRKKVAILTQQLEKLQWEQKADREKISFDQRRQKETEENIKQIKDQIEDHEKRIEVLMEYSRSCTESLADKKQKEAVLTNEIESSKRRIAEVNEELNKIVSDLHNAKIDVHEGKRQQMRAETLESLKRLYPDYVVEAINEQLREIKGSKMMIDVIQTSFPPLKKIIQFVCGNGLVCETVKEARQLAFDGPHRLKTVALDGTLFLKSGIISGGSSYLKMKARYWDEKEVNELKDQREKLMNELKDLLKIRRKETDLKYLQAQCQGIQTRYKYSQNELEVLKKKQLANFYKEKSMLESEVVNIQSQCSMLNEGVLQRAAKMDELQKKINEMEDNIFHEFCEEIGVENIRVYEKEYIQLQEEIDKKRFEFENQKTRLSVQLEYICSLIEKEAKKNNMLKESIHKDEADVIHLKKDEENCLQMVEENMVELQQLREKQNVNKNEVAAAQNQIEESRKILLTLNRELVTLQKEAVAIETSLEQKKLERHNRLLECKLQDLRINLLLGSLDDISEIELGPDTESSEKTADIYEREQLIQIDYSKLADELKDLQSNKEIDTHLEQLQQEIASKEDVLLKTAAPNLKALERLHIVTNRFQESVDAFEVRRREARLCRQEFEKVKKRRYELFSQCFEHVSVAIDQTYKKLCRNNSAQAFLSPENPEEPYLEGIGFNCVAPGKRFMPMDNLSGGEKSVAALALVFAIHRQSPPPVCAGRKDMLDPPLNERNLSSASIPRVVEKVALGLAGERWQSSSMLAGAAEASEIIPLNTESEGEIRDHDLPVFRPAPFFILDEVDAALDNTNIGKVSDFIRQHSQEQFQIIVISLKEEFYSKADALIGVCPQQDEVMFSQVLTLDLTKYAEPENERRQKRKKSSLLK